jgi:acetyl-CoA carboxylase beta subunit
MAEFLLLHGPIDQIVHELELKNRIEYFSKAFGYAPKNGKIANSRNSSRQRFTRKLEEFHAPEK